MLDWWTVPGERWGLEDLAFKVELRPDTLTRPDFAEGYSEADLDAFEGEDWQYAEVTVTPVTPELTDMVAYRTHLIGVDWGRLAESEIDRPDVTDDQVKGLALEIVTAMRKDGLTVTVSRDSEFGVAPF